MTKSLLKYPVILVHGIAAMDKNFFWGRIPGKMKEQGIKLFLGNTDSWGSIESNAVSLKETVDTILKAQNCEKVNIIAHSKGGLDARFLISSMQYATKVASLTTISTPHYGSEIIDFIFEKKTVYNHPISKKIINLLVKLYGDKSPDPYRIILEMTTKNMIHFNLKNPDQQTVYYSSYHSIMKNELDDPSYLISYNYLKRIAGDNDGIVSLKSAQWGDNFNLIKGMKGKGISHSEIIDIKRKNISGVDIPGEYLKIIKSLSQKGF